MFLHRFTRHGRLIGLVGPGVPVLLLVLVLVLALAGGAGCAKSKKAAELYHCPMHPTYVSDHPADCPICGMRLVPIKGQAGGENGGDTSSTGASVPRPDLKTPEAASSSGRPILYYRSPMDPQVTSPVPAKDQMGMDFVPVYEGQGQSDRGVPTHAAVTVSEEGMRLAGIRTIPAVRGVLHRSVRAVGLVKSDERLVHQVTLKSAGYVERLFVGTTGQRVRKGDPILSIYSPDLLAAQSEFLQALRSAHDLAASGSKEARENAEELRQSARTRLELLDLPATMLQEIEQTGTPERTVVFAAPVSGYVTAKQVLAGMRVEPGTELYTVTDLSKVWIEADFYEDEASYLKVGQEATLTLPYDPAARLSGTVSLIYPVLDPGSRTLKVRFEVDNAGLVLKPGMYANAELQIQSLEGILIPDNAVLDTGERQLVFVESSPGEFVPHSVRVGLRGNGQALLLEGVTEGDSVVVQANFLLDSESRIRAAFSGAGQ